STYSTLGVTLVSAMCSSSCLFFFQAEDGIRDATVTGVQTCALPISISAPYSNAVIGVPVTFRQSATDADNHLRTNLGATYVQDQIGRASCRERVEVAGVVVGC